MRKIHYSMAWHKAVYQRSAWTVLLGNSQVYMMM